MVGPNQAAVTASVSMAASGITEVRCCDRSPGAVNAASSLGVGLSYQPRPAA
jgi:hypothetical protein